MKSALVTVLAESLSEGDESHLLRLLAENVLDYAIFVIDGERQVRTWTAGAERLLGYTEAEILGKSADIFFTPEDREAGEPEREANQALTFGRGDDDRWHLKKDGSRFWSSGVLTPLLDETGTLRGFAKIMRDRTDLKQAEIAQADALSYAESIVETVREPLVVLDSDLRVRTANRSFYRTFGVSPEQTEGQLIYDLGNRQWDIPELRTLLEEILPENTTFDNFEVVHEFEEIGQRSMLLNARKSEGNHTQLILLAIEDVTERRRLEAERQEIETRFTALVKNIRDHSIFTLDTGGKITSWNSEAERILGYSEAEAIGLDFSVIFTPEDIEAGKPDWELRTARQEGRAEDERWHLKRGGERFWAFGIVTPMYDSNGKLTGYSKILRDMTARKQAEEQNQFQAHLLDTVGQAVIATDPEGTILYWNRFAEHLYGWSNEEAVGRDISELVVVPEEASEAETIMNRLRAGQSWSGEFTVRRKDGTSFPAYVTNASILDGDGHVRAIVGVSTDVSERKNAEEVMQASEHRTRSILESITDAFFALDRQWNFTYVNQRAGELLGRTDLVGKNLWTEFPEAPGSDFERFYRQAMEEEMTVLFEAYYPSHERWYDVNAYPSPDGLSVYFRDANERRRAAEERERLLAEVKAERNRLQAVIDNVPVSVILAEAPSGRMVLGNRQIERMLRHSFRPSPDVPSYTDWVGFHADGRQVAGHEWPLARALQGEVVYGEEYLYQRGDGTNAWIRASAAPISDGKSGIAGAVVAINDIDAEKRSAEQLRRRAEQLRLLASASVTVNTSLSVESVLRVVTEEARSIIGAHQAVGSLTADERWSQAITTVSLSEKYEAWQSYDAEPDGSGIYSLVCSTNRPMRLSQEELVSHPAWRNFSDDADHPPMRGWLAAPLVARNGSNLGIIQLSDKDDGDFTDEDEAILLQLASTASVALENARLYDELRDADRRKDDFLAMLAHELRNPLAPIRSGLELLSMDGVDSEIVGIMSDQVGHVVRLVDDLLDVSRILRGKVTLRKEQTDLSVVLRRAAETVRSRIQEHRQQLHVSLPNEPVWLDADPVRLTQVVTNLLHNASKYTENGGELRLTAECEGEQAIIAVSDTGIGISTELLPKVFDLFTQADQALDRSQGGLGIGLTVVKSLVEMHGGTIGGESEGSGKGSTFTVRLPIATSEAVSAVDGPSDVLATSCRILVVDDNIPAAKLLVRLLERLDGHEIRSVHDGSSALAAAEEFQPDVILLDIGLPKMDGYEVARRLRMEPERDRTLLVALTGYGTADDRRKSIAAGFDDHLVKPPSVEMLRQVLAHPKLKQL